MSNLPKYQAKPYQLSGLTGITDETMAMHFKLYAGYVKEANALSEKVAEFLAAGEVSPEKMTAYAETVQRFHYERNGMSLHEYFFENLKQGHGELPAEDSLFMRKIQKSFSSYDAWKKDFVNTGNVRGVGWALCCQDSANGRLANHWIFLHDLQSIGASEPILVLDVWEHAYLLDYKPSEREGYIDAFFYNINWAAIESRLQKLETTTKEAVLFA